MVEAEYSYFSADLNILVNVVVNIHMNILSLVTFLFSNVLMLWMWSKSARLQGFKNDITQINTCKNVISIEHAASAVAVAFCLVLATSEKF